MLFRSLDVVADTLYECVEKRYLRLKAGKRADLQAEYEQHLYRRGLRSTFERPGGERFPGMIQGVETDGRLRLETERGVERFDLKELRFIV